MKIKGNKKILFAALCIIIVLLIALIAFLINRPQAIRVAREVQDSYSAGNNYTLIDQSSGRVKVCENDKLVMYLEGSNGSVVIKDKASGELFFTVPEKALEDTKASKDMLNQLNAPLWLTYYNIKAQKTVVFDSYSNASLLNQISYSTIDGADGVSVKLTLGRAESSMLIPEQISAASFDALLQRVEDANGKRAVKKVTSLYLLYTYETANDDQKAKYPSLKDTDIYVLKTSANSRNKNELEECFKSIGYTYEEMEAEYINLGFTSKVEAFACFDLTMNYILEDDHLKVEVNVGDITYDRDNFILTNLTVLPFFGAGITGEEGYSFIPDGSGAIVNFNNDGAKKTLLTTGRLYGFDAAETNVDRGSQRYEFRYPVFGVKKKDTAVVGIITDGDAVANINCQVGNIAHLYNTAYASFIISQNAQYESFSQEQVAWVQYDRKGYDGCISLEYHLLSGDEADYSGMAKAYQDYLLRKVLSTRTTAKNIPLYIDTLGTIGNYVRIAGIPDYRNVEVTSYKEAEEMLEYFADNGLNNINLRYTSCVNGGIENYVSTKLELEKACGSKRQLKSLNKKAEELNANLYIDIPLMKAGQNTYTDSYIASSDGIRNLFQKQAYYPYVDNVMMRTLSWDYCVNPTKLLSIFNKLNKDYSKLGIKNISLGDVGVVLNSNYRKSEYVNRQDSELISKELMNQAANEYSNVIVDSGNAYTFGMANTILNLPLTASNYLIEDASVPFIQIALHGFIDYAGEPINKSSDIENEVLKCIEYGSAPYFVLCDSEGSTIKNAYLKYLQLYSVTYDIWKERVVDIYERIDEALALVQGAAIVKHEMIEENVFKTSYDNDVEIIVNYSDVNIRYKNNNIMAKGYLVLNKGVAVSE